jgi:hypothetical protein
VISALANVAALAVFRRHERASKAMMLPALAAGN